MKPNTGATVMVSIFVGLVIGLLAGSLVSNYNSNIERIANRQKLIELGVGSYDSKTGAFQVMACPK